MLLSKIIASISAFLQKYLGLQFPQELYLGQYVSAVVDIIAAGLGFESTIVFFDVTATGYMSWRNTSGRTILVSSVLFTRNSGTWTMAGLHVYDLAYRRVYYEFFASGTDFAWLPIKTIVLPPNWYIGISCDTLVGAGICELRIAGVVV